MRVKFLSITFESILTIDCRTVSKTNPKSINNSSKFFKHTNANPSPFKTYTVKSPLYLVQRPIFLKILNNFYLSRLHTQRLLLRLRKKQLLCQILLKTPSLVIGVLLEILNYQLWVTFQSLHLLRVSQRRSASLSLKDLLHR